ncbi:MAG: hypothetical protein AVDCRST_MAG22-2273, partial [uncultured Rubrobacteraceae bacterium]
GQGTGNGPVSLHRATRTPPRRDLLGVRPPQRPPRSPHPYPVLRGRPAGNNGLGRGLGRRLPEILPRVWPRHRGSLGRQIGM